MRFFPAIIVFSLVPVFKTVWALTDDSAGSKCEFAQTSFVPNATYCYSDPNCKCKSNLTAAYVFCAQTYRICILVLSSCFLVHQPDNRVSLPATARRLLQVCALADPTVLSQEITLMTCLVTRAPVTTSGWPSECLVVLPHTLL